MAESTAYPVPVVRPTFHIAVVESPHGTLAELGCSNMLSAPRYPPIVVARQCGKVHSCRAGELGISGCYAEVPSIRRKSTGLSSDDVDVQCTSRASGRDDASCCVWCGYMAAKAFTSYVAVVPYGYNACTKEYVDRFSALSAVAVSRPDERICQDVWVILLLLGGQTPCEVSAEQNSIMLGRPWNFRIG